jgi:hypothetical protein
MLFPVSPLVPGMNADYTVAVDYDFLEEVRVWDPCIIPVCLNLPISIKTALREWWT